MNMMFHQVWIYKAGQWLFLFWSDDLPEMERCRKVLKAGGHITALSRGNQFHSVYEGAYRTCK